MAEVSMESMVMALEGGFSPPALACSACREAHTACSKERPCKRCALMGKACYDPEKKKRGRPKKTEQRQRQQQYQREPHPPSKKARATGTRITYLIHNEVFGAATRIVHPSPPQLVHVRRHTDLPPLFPMAAGGGSAPLPPLPTPLPTQMLPQLVANGNGLHAGLDHGGGGERTARSSSSSAYGKPATNGRFDDGLDGLTPLDFAGEARRHHQPAPRPTNEGLPGTLLCLLVEHMRDLKKELRETKRRQDGIEDLLRDLRSKIDTVPSLVAAAVTAATNASCSYSSTSPASGDPADEASCSSPLSPSIPLINTGPATNNAGLSRNAGCGAGQPTSFTLLPGFSVPPPRQQVAGLFPFLGEYNLGLSDRPFVGDNPGKPIVILRMMSHNTPGEEGAAPLIVYVNDLFCSLMGYTRNELVGSPITKLAMPDYAFKDETTKRFLSPPGTLIGDIFALPMLVVKRSGIPARAHNRYQFFYNGKRRQRWLFAATDGLDEGDITLNPSSVVQPAVWYRSTLMLEQRVRELEQQTTSFCGAPAQGGSEATTYDTQPPQYHQQGNYTPADMAAGGLTGDGHGNDIYLYPVRDHDQQQRAFGDNPVEQQQPQQTTPSPGDAPSEPPSRAQEFDESISDLLASMGGRSPSSSFPASPYSSFSSFY